MKQQISHAMMSWSIYRFTLLHTPRTVFQTMALLLRIRRLPFTSNRPLAITFSISEDYARLWLWHARRALSPLEWDFAVIDSTGTMRARYFTGASLIRFINVPHGNKIDLFLRRFIHAREVFLCDDDMYCMRSLAAERALFALPRTAIVSLRPRVAYHLRHNGVLHRPMGTYALFINREIIVRENIRFRSPRGNSCRRVFNRPPGSKNNLSFDTGDYANERLLELEYAVRHGEPGGVLGFFGLTQPRLLLECYGKKRIKESILRTSRFRVGGGGVALMGLYSVHTFEKIFMDIFGEPPVFISGFSADELRSMAESAPVPREERDEVMRKFNETDALYKDLRTAAELHHHAL